MKPTVRTFPAPNADVGANHFSNAKLYVNDEAKTKVAKFNPKGFSAGSAPATLVVYPEGEQMVDLIVVMLVYIEIKRRDHHS